MTNIVITSSTNTIKNIAVGAVLAGAGFVGGLTGGIEASEVKTFDASQASKVEEVRIFRTVTAPATTEESFTLNDLNSEIEGLDFQIARLQERKAALVAKRDGAITEATVKFEEEVTKREEAKSLKNNNNEDAI